MYGIRREDFYLCAVYVHVMAVAGRSLWAQGERHADENQDCRCAGCQKSTLSTPARKAAPTERHAIIVQSRRHALWQICKSAGRERFMQRKTAFTTPAAASAAASPPYSPLHQHQKLAQSYPYAPERSHPSPESPCSVAGPW